MWDVIVRLRRFQTEIEADLLREYRIDLADWHTGKLSSRRVLALIDNLSESSSYKTTFERAGNWPVWQQMLKQAANEVTLHRASLYAGSENAYEPMVYLDPLEMAERLADDEAMTVGHRQAEEELYGALGWT